MITEIKLIRYRLSSEKNYDITSDGVQFLKEKKKSSRIVQTEWYLIAKCDSQLCYLVRIIFQYLHD